MGRINQKKGRDDASDERIQIKDKDWKKTGSIVEIRIKLSPAYTRQHFLP